jgi:hypothetical protein
MLYDWSQILRKITAGVFMKDQTEKNSIMATTGLVCIHAIAEYLILLERGLNLFISGLSGYGIDDNMDN